jgi:hypothetical protein
MQLGALVSTTCEDPKKCEAFLAVENGCPAGCSTPCICRSKKDIKKKKEQLSKSLGGGGSCKGKKPQRKGKKTARI